MKVSLALRLAPASAALLLALPLCADGGSAASAVAEGNRQYAGGKYDEAILNYQKALQELPESPEVFFNLGAAEYQKKNYEQAGKLFGRSIALSAALQAPAAYNLGGALYREGKLIESLAAFKKAIELDPRDADAKFNYELVSLKLKEQEQKPPPKPEEKQDQKKPEEQKQEEQSAAPQPSPSPAASPPPPEPRQEMNRDEAERMLDALKAEEEEQREERVQEKPQELPEVLKDW